jgi:hypothetical protein
MFAARDDLLVFCEVERRLARATSRAAKGPSLRPYRRGDKRLHANGAARRATRECRPHGTEQLLQTAPSPRGSRYRGFAYSSAPAKSMATYGSSPTTHAS